MNKKIIVAVVSYDEFNKCPDKNEVLEDLMRFYKSLEAESKDLLGNKFRSQLEEIETGFLTCEFINIPTDSPYDRRHIIPAIENTECDVLVTYNLVGFDLVTLTDGLAYNLLDCRQIHFVDDPKYFEMDNYKKIKSINMFVVDKSRMRLQIH